MLIGICSDKQSEIERISKCIIQYTRFLSEDRLLFFTPNEILIDIEYHKFQCDLIVIKTNCKAENLNGIQIASQIVLEYPECQVIFYSDYYNQVSEVYQVKHCYFILLNQMEQYISSAFEQAEKQIGSKNPAILEFVCNRHKVYIQCQEILYIKRDNRVTIVSTTKQEYKSYIPLAEILDKVGHNFVRCHTGYIVNMDYVEWVANDTLQLLNKQKIPVGRVYIKHVREKFAKRWKSM